MLVISGILQLLHFPINTEERSRERDLEREKKKKEMVEERKEEEKEMVEERKEEERREEMVELNTGFPLLIQQFKALLKKNLIIVYRNKISTLIQLFSSLFFIALLLILDKSLNSNNTIYDPEPDVFPPIPPCEDKYFIKRDSCFDFVWSGKQTPKLQSIVDSIMLNNPGRPIPSSKVKYFETSIEVDAWFFEDPRRSPGAVHFIERNATVISYGVQTNSTDAKRRGHSEDPTLKFQIPLQIAAERAIARSLLKGPNFSWLLGVTKFPYPDISTFNTMATAGPPFFLAFTMFRFVFQIGSLVTERELKLRQAMSTMGLYETAYWLSWFTWEAFMTLLSSLFLVLFGILSKFDFFIHNSFRIVFLVFFLFQVNMIGFAFFLSTLLSKSSSAGTTGFTIFILSILALPISKLGFPYVPGFALKYRVAWSLFPPNLFSQAISMLLTATKSPEDEGISWSKRADCGPQSAFISGSCTITIAGIYKWLMSTFFVWLLLALYFDNVLPNSSGLRKSFFYFLNPGYWTGKGGSNGEEGGLFRWTSLTPPPENVIPSDQDVQEEENIVKQQMNESADDSNIAVQIRGLVKTYFGTITGRCKFKRTKPYHAVKGLWMNLEKDQLFCLLGPNGAGKTTAISCLTGIVPVTSGDALIYGHSVRSSVGMSNIRRLMGVCPQFDILWEGLSGEDHLHLFASIKGLPPAEINLIAKKSLKEVRLTEVARVRAGSYSGGMKRRLSVAIALIGDPKLVILDEPTTGMDPITRRHVWDIIENAKKGRVIVLTTHSMEEADILSDRIAIMAKGKLRCIGTSIRLKSKFGTGFIASVSFEGRTPPVDGDSVAANEPHHVAVKQFFKQHLDVVPKEETMSFLTFVIPHEKEGLLTNFFSELQDRQKEFGIIDIQLGLTTLEEVFLNIAKKAELESALLEGNLVTLTLTSGTDLQIPKGSRFVGIPGTESEEHPSGLMVEVYWEQDESGNLCISGHSLETPVPQNLQQVVATAADNLDRKPLEQIGPIKGILLDSVNG